MKAEIRITLDEKGKIRVEGPLTDMVLMYGLLERAKDIVKDYSDKKTKADIVVPKTPIVPIVPGGGKKQ